MCRRQVAVLGLASLLFAVSVLTVVAGEPAAPSRAGRVPLQKGPKGEIQRKLQTIVIPEFKAEETVAQDVLADLIRKAKELDPAKQGVNVIYNCRQADLMTPVTIEFKKMPLGEALLHTCRACHMDYTIEDYTIIIFSKADEAK